MKKFWMVKGVGPTSHEHPTREAAVKEAERLANQHPNCPFYVMEAMSYSRSIRTVERGECTEEKPSPAGGWRRVRDWRDIGKTVFNSTKFPSGYIPEDKWEGRGCIPCDRNFRLQVIDKDGFLVGGESPWQKWGDKDRVWVWDEELDEESDVPF